MCEHKKDTGKKVVVSWLCRKCQAQENFDRKQIELLRKKAS